MTLQAIDPTRKCQVVLRAEDHGRQPGDIPAEVGLNKLVSALSGKLECM